MKRNQMGQAPVLLVSLLAMLGCSDSSSSSNPDGSRRDAGLADSPAATPDARLQDGSLPDSPNGQADVSTTRRDAASDAVTIGNVAADGGILCVGPENTAPVIHATVVPEGPPIPRGGTIYAGIYYETSVTRYSGTVVPPDAGARDTFQQTAIIEGPDPLDGSFRLTVSRIGINTVYIVNLVPEPKNPARVQFVYLCPDSPSIPLYDYDATPTSLTIYYTDYFGPLSYTLTRQ